MFLYIARKYRLEKSQAVGNTLEEKILQYINSHLETVTLKDIAARFSYHPNYISTLLHQKLGKKFSDIVREKRMERATILMRGTDLSIEEISSMLGYSDMSNFYKAFHSQYGTSPREYVKKEHRI